MKPRDYCCCAIPLVNTGIYTALVEQLVLGITAGVLAISTDPIVGAATPSFAPWIFAVICWVGAGVQFLGFLGVKNEKAGLFRRYAQLNSLVIIAAFAVAVVWIIISATRHTTAQSKCEKKFFPIESTGETTSEGETICNIFPWVDIGIMGGLWVLLAIVQMYLLVVISSYSSAQRSDHKRIDGEYDPANPLTGPGDIPMQSRSDPWDSRPSTDTVTDGRGGTGREYSHVRQGSSASVATTLGEKVQRPAEYTSYGGGYGAQAPVQPSYAYTQDPEPTPYYQNQYYTEGIQGDVDRPERMQPHPAEGSFGRKMPRQPSGDHYTNSYYPQR